MAGICREPRLRREDLRDILQQAEEKMFEVGVYIALYADTTEELAKLESQLIPDIIA